MRWSGGWLAGWLVITRARGAVVLGGVLSACVQLQWAGLYSVSLCVFCHFCHKLCAALCCAANKHQVNERLRRQQRDMETAAYNQRQVSTCHVMGRDGVRSKNTADSCAASCRAWSSLYRHVHLRVHNCSALLYRPPRRLRLCLCILFVLSDAAGGGAPPVDRTQRSDEAHRAGGANDSSKGAPGRGAAASCSRFVLLLKNCER